jgi:hypothetical protein
MIAWGRQPTLEIFEHLPVAVLSTDRSEHQAGKLAE